MSWELTDHCCRVCFSRILSQHADGKMRYLCSGCGITGEGPHPRVICSCGLQMKTVTRREVFKNGRPGTTKDYGMKDMGVRCTVNDDVSPENPYLIVARQTESGR